MIPCRRLLVFLTLGSWCACARAAEPHLQTDAFESPTVETHPTVWWRFMDDHVTREGITGDLDFMRRVDLNGGMASFCASRAGLSKQRKVSTQVPILSNDWWDIMGFQLGEAAKRRQNRQPARRSITMNTKPKSLSRTLLLGAMALCLPITNAAPAVTESPAQRDERMAWWRDARFGMFVHWGLYSGLAGNWDGKPVRTRGGMEWIQNFVKADTDTYAKAALPKFQPKPGFAREWAKLAKNAGCRYLVFTTKHHDGFGLHASKSGDYNAGAKLQRDLVKEIVEACRAEGLKVGFYHSLIDWHHDQYDNTRTKGLPYPLGGKPLQNAPRDHSKYIKYLHSQVDELLSNYGPVDILWWDFSSRNFQGDEAWGATDLMKLVRTRQPQIIVNNRLYSASTVNAGDAEHKEFSTDRGDFTTPEQRIPATGMPGVDWETCMTLNTTWGYSDHDHAWKSDKILIRNLIDIASKGGNYLLNIGPKGDGSLTRETIRSFEAIGAWMKTNGEAIHGTTASPFADLKWGRATRQGQNIYLFVLDWPKDRKLLVPLRNHVEQAAMLAPGVKPPAISSTNEGIVLDLPANAPDSLATVIKLTIKGEPEVIDTHSAK